jgi:peroxiredoxin
MTYTNNNRLDIGDPFPEMTLSLVDGNFLTLPGDLNGNWSVCCRRQLSDFQKRLDDFAQRGITVIGGSIDTREKAHKTKERTKVTYPLVYGLNARVFAQQTGSFFDDKDGYLHSTDFIIDPDGKVADAVYSTGPIGRYTPDECLSLIDYWIKKETKKNR